MGAGARRSPEAATAALRAWWRDPAARQRLEQWLAGVRQATVSSYRLLRELPNSPPARGLAQWWARGAAGPWAPRPG